MVDLVTVFSSMESLEGLGMVVMVEETAAYLMAIHMVLLTQTCIWGEAQVLRRVSQHRSSPLSSSLCAIDCVRYLTFLSHCRLEDHHLVDLTILLHCIVATNY